MGQPHQAPQMDSKTGLEAHPESLSERDKRILATYGKLPCGGQLGQQAKKRVYFDSGDFALSAAHRVTDNGAIQTGSAHPVRESISHPHVPIPNTSADKDPEKVLREDRSSIAEIARSPLAQAWDGASVDSDLQE